MRKALELYAEMKSRLRIGSEYLALTNLISAASKVGYTEVVFQLYDEYRKEHKKKPSSTLVTNLIRSCAECPFKEYGLSKLNWLEDHLMIDHTYKYSLRNYDALIKAYGRLGKSDKVGEIFENMINSGIRPDASTFTKLIATCGNDTLTGSTKAIRIFKIMKSNNIRTNESTYEALALVIRKCGFGDGEELTRVFAELPDLTPFKEKMRYLQASSTSKDKFVSIPELSKMGSAIKKCFQVSDHLTRYQNPHRTSHDEKLIQDITPIESPPNLLLDDHRIFNQIQAIQMDRLNNRFQRLSLFGGLRGFIEAVIKDRLNPTSKLLTTLMGCIEPIEENILEILELSRIHNIKRDDQFYCRLIGIVCEDGSYKDRIQIALKLLEEMQFDVRPNVAVFENLALGCNDLEMSKKLMQDMENCGFVVTDKMIFNFFRHPLRFKNVPFTLDLLRLCIERRVRPTRALIQELERFKSATLYDVLKLEKARPASWLQNAMRNQDIFDQLLERWLKTVELVPDEHPWEQFKVNNQSKRHGFNLFVKDFKTMIEAKEEALAENRDLGKLALASSIKNRELDDIKCESV